MDEGYPGNLKVTVDYKLTQEDELIIEYSAVSDQDTVINLTNHAVKN
jgi:aldose 1-epimerase